MHGQYVAMGGLAVCAAQGDMGSVAIPWPMSHLHEAVYVAQYKECKQVKHLRAMQVGHLCIYTNVNAML